MRLVACQGCHAQFDVTDVARKEFPCRCGATVSTEPLRAVEAEVHRCASCGALVQSDAAACAFCGSEVVRDLARLSLICPECYARNGDDARFCTACGVAFQPEPIPSDAKELPCPDCGVLMAARRLASVDLNECPRCNGLWVPGEHFEALVTRAAEQHRQGGLPTPDGPRSRGANPLHQKVRYRKCPACEAFMHRRNFRKVSGVIVDRCADHGTWLDADELEQIAGYILSGGRPDASQAMRRETAAAAASYREVRQEKDRQTARDLTPLSTGFGGLRESGSLLGLLTDLLG